MCALERLHAPSFSLFSSTCSPSRVHVSWRSCARGPFFFGVSAQDGTTPIDLGSGDGGERLLRQQWMERGEEDQPGPLQSVAVASSSLKAPGVGGLECSLPVSEEDGSASPTAGGGSGVTWIGGSLKKEKEEEMGGAFFFPYEWWAIKITPQRNGDLYGNNGGLKRLPPQERAHGSDGTREFRGHDVI